MGNFYTDVIVRDSRFRTTAAVADPALLEPGFAARVATTLAAAKAAGTELRITETFRSTERQQQLYAQGKTRLKTVGVHHYGLACDVAKVIRGRLSWDGDWSFLARLAAAQGIISGYDWGRPDITHDFQDKDHLQGVSVAQQPALFAGTWYPGIEIAPAFKTLRRGDSGPNVTLYQKCLGVVADGKFGPQTAIAVVGFQGTHNLPMSGEIDQKTSDALLSRR